MSLRPVWATLTQNSKSDNIRRETTAEWRAWLVGGGEEASQALVQNWNVWMPLGMR